MSAKSLPSLAKPNWARVLRICFDWSTHSLYRDNLLGVEKRVFARRRWSDFNQQYKVGKSRTSYFIDGDKVKYLTEAEMLEALAAKKEGSK